eukprot:scaffold145182_cov38-Prasinocladus_malaysianus.AAC.1
MGKIKRNRQTPAVYADQIMLDTEQRRGRSPSALKCRLGRGFHILINRPDPQDTSIVKVRRVSGNRQARVALSVMNLTETSVLFFEFHLLSSCQQCGAHLWPLASKSINTEDCIIALADLNNSAVPHRLLLVTVALGRKEGRSGPLVQRSVELMGGVVAAAAVGFESEECVLHPGLLNAHIQTCNIS